jgi:pyocin large subunit-like protein
VLPLEDPEDPEDLCSSTTGAKEGPISSFVLVVRFIPRSDDVDVVIITSRPGAVSVTV